MSANTTAHASSAPSRPDDFRRDRKSTRLNSSHGYISYAVFCLKKKTHAEQHGDVRGDVQGVRHRRREQRVAALGRQPLLSERRVGVRGGAVGRVARWVAGDAEE